MWEIDGRTPLLAEAPWLYAFFQLETAREFLQEACHERGITGEDTFGMLESIREDEPVGLGSCLQAFLVCSMQLGVGEAQEIVTYLADVKQKVSWNRVLSSIGRSEGVCEAACAFVASVGASHSVHFRDAMTTLADDLRTFQQSNRHTTSLYTS